ncbi:MAG: hypothetical protein M3032_00040 [Verrucomicrobiota bacterium]|nr:hypothetical protein [Verrucomicrobiota bacterium]
MSTTDELPSLWNYGEPEAWRRGRTILLTIGGCHFVVQAILFAGMLSSNTLELALAFAVDLVLWWLAFAFIWLGVHWVRWLAGAWMLLVGLAFFVWGTRDSLLVEWSAGVLDIIVGAFFFAPSVHFFAVRQKEEIRWPEKLIVGAVFLILLASFMSALIGVNLYRAAVQRDAEDYGEEALNRIFVQDDTAYLLAEATDLWRNNARGNLGVTQVVTDKYMRLGYVENTRVKKVTLRSLFEFPSHVRYAGLVEGEGMAGSGLVILRLELRQSAGHWRINGVSWQPLNTRASPM